MTRIAHISDIHLRQFSSFTLSDLYNKRALGALNLFLRRNKQHDPSLFDACCQDLIQESPDEIVITGDVTNVSLRSEFAIVKDKLHRYGFDPNHVSIIPGNHDVYVKQAQREQLFESFLGAYCTSDGMSVLHPVEFPFVRIRGQVALVGVSTAVPTLPFSATGRLGKTQLSRLEQALSSLTSHYRVLLIHHPPIPYRKDHIRGLKDKQELQLLLRRVGCELILHGHEHRDLMGSIAGPDSPIPVIGVGSGTYNSQHMSRRARYNIYTITDRKLTGIETRVHDPTQNKFVHQSSH